VKGQSYGACCQVFLGHLDCGVLMALFRKQYLDQCNCAGDNCRVVLRIPAETDFLLVKLVVDVGFRISIQPDILDLIDALLLGTWKTITMPPFVPILRIPLRRRTIRR
jgi:hypothetical protein